MRLISDSKKSNCFRINSVIFRRSSLSSFSINSTSEETTWHASTPRSSSLVSKFVNSVAFSIFSRPLTVVKCLGIGVPELSSVWNDVKEALFKILFMSYFAQFGCPFGCGCAFGFSNFKLAFLFELTFWYVDSKFSDRRILVAQFHCLLFKQDCSLHFRVKLVYFKIVIAFASSH